MSRPPRVSVCLCTYNGAATVGRALASILAQEHGDLEVLVVDDRSGDDTVDRVRALADPRVRVVVNPVTLGNAGNRSRAIQLSRGEFVTFVDQDDRITPDCLSQHLAVMDGAPSVGLTAARRGISLDGPPSSELRAWIEAYGRLERLEGVGEVNDGWALLGRHLEAGPFVNWLGEPSAVMLRRSVLVASRLFHRRLHQLLDLDLWLRVMAHADVGLLDAELTVRGVSVDTHSEANRRSRRNWLDRLWMLEGLRAFPRIWAGFPSLSELLVTERKSLVVATATGRFRVAGRAEALRDDLSYGAFLMRVPLGARGRLFDGLGS